MEATIPYLLTAIGAACAVSLSCYGSAAASSMAASYSMACKGTMSHVPIIISGVLGIYGLIIGIILSSFFTKEDEIGTKQGCANLAAGLVVGLACYASGLGMEIFLGNSLYGEDYRARRQQNKGLNGNTEPLLTKSDTFVPLREPYPITLKFVVQLVFLEALGLYGLIVGLLFIG